MDEPYIFTENKDGSSYTIKVPRLIKKDQENFIEITNYKSKFDNYKDRYGTVFIFIEDKNVTESVLKFDGLPNLNYVEEDLFKEKILIPTDLIKDKNGTKRLTVVIFDFILNSNSKLKSEDKVNMQYIDTREHYNVFIE